MKQSYDKSIPLICATCGSECSFEKNEETGVITCKKCNRVYYGGYDEVVELNQQRINDELEATKEEIMKDVNSDILKAFKKAGFKIK